MWLQLGAHLQLHHTVGTFVSFFLSLFWPPVVTWIKVNQSPTDMQHSECFAQLRQWGSPWEFGWPTCLTLRSSAHDEELHLDIFAKALQTHCDIAPGWFFALFSQLTWETFSCAIVCNHWLLPSLVAKSHLSEKCTTFKEVKEGRAGNYQDGKPVIKSICQIIIVISEKLWR